MPKVSKKSIKMLIFNLVTISPNDSENLRKATFAGGCFWCMELPFERLDGVKEVVSGYTGGNIEDPSYEEVSTGKTDHYEAVQISFNPKEITYRELLQVYWRQIDPTDPGGQFADRGSQYRTAIFYHDGRQKEIAEKSKRKLEKSGIFDKPIASEILPFENFYEAEEHHQEYYKKNPSRYDSYKQNSGRKKFIEKEWKCENKMNEGSNSKSKEELKEGLTSLQFEVTQENGTEPSYDNEYWDHYEPGIYVDIVSGEPLFSSKDKCDILTYQIWRFGRCFRPF